MSNNTYQPPKVWEWKQNNGGAYANINRPVSGATHEKELPVGEHPLQLYSLGTPNGQKVTIMLEELLALGVTGAEYDAWLIRIGEGDQFSSGFVDVNPNSKIPALRDHSTTPPTRVFESGNILLYLAEKFGHFLPKDPAGRTETLNWLFWLQGAAPFLGGGFGHFYNYAPVKIEYAIDRFTMEAKRLFDVLDKQLGRGRYVAGEEYTIADMAIWPWFGCVALGAQLVNDTGTTMEAILRDVTEVTVIMKQIATASEEQSKGISQVGVAITQMDGVTQQNASLVEQVSAAAAALERQTEELQRSVQKFRLPA